MIESVFNPGNAQLAFSILVLVIGAFLTLIGTFGPDTKIKMGPFEFLLESNPKKRKSKIKATVVRIFALVVGIPFCVAGSWGIWQLALKPKPKIIFAVDLAQHELNIFHEIKDEYEKIEENRVEVVLKPMDLKEIFKKLETEKRIDVAMIDVNGDLGKIGKYLEDLRDHKGLLPSGVHPTFIEWVRKYPKRYYIPFRPNVRLVFRNRDAFEGLKPKCKDRSKEECEQLLTSKPRTWGDLVKVSKLVKQLEGQPKVALYATEGSGDTGLLLELIRSYGGDPCFNSTDENKEAVNVLKDLWPEVDQTVSRGFDFRTASGLLASGGVYIGRDWSTTLRILSDAGMIDEFEVYEGWEAGDNRPPIYMLGGNFLAVPKTAENIRRSVDFMRYMISKKVQRNLAEKLYWPPIRIDAMPLKDEKTRKKHSTIWRALMFAKPIPSGWKGEDGLQTIYSKIFKTILNSGAKSDIDTLYQEAQRVCAEQSK